jgi:hypothetical protein
MRNWRRQQPACDPAGQHVAGSGQQSSADSAGQQRGLDESQHPTCEPGGQQISDGGQQTSIEPTGQQMSGRWKGGVRVHALRKQVSPLAQVLPQAPQFASSNARLASQPSRGSSLQSSNPGMHSPTSHWPPAQTPLACGSWQRRPSAGTQAPVRQVEQGPVQGTLQQTSSSVQMPERHWLESVQGFPLSSLGTQTAWSRSQKYSGEQSMSPEHPGTHCLLASQVVPSGQSALLEQPTHSPAASLQTRGVQSKDSPGWQVPNPSQVPGEIRMLPVQAADWHTVLAA